MQEYKRLNTAQMVQYMWHLSCRRQDSWRKQTRNSETIAQKVAIRAFTSTMEYYISSFR